MDHLLRVSLTAWSYVRSLMGTLALRQKMRIGEQPIGRGNMVKCDGQRITFSPGFGVLSPFVLMSIVTMSCGACCAPEYHTGPAFISRRYYLQHQRHDKTGARRMRVKSSLESSAGSNDGNAKDSDIAVNEESWCLGDGGFANRHLGDEERIIAKKKEKDFFRERSLSVYDQMREASMLLLAQQQILATEEAREQASTPRFIAAAGAQAVRERQKQRDATAGLLPTPVISPPARGEQDKASGPVVLPTAPDMLSGVTLGVGGLDEELEEIRRRVCVPLAAPVDLLADLGITPVRGLLLHGPPGCGKTLLAKRLSAALTRRPPTVVSGPEILERFVGSSEANVRALFDYPPDAPDASDLHVIVLDEFDSIGQRRGGGDDGGDRVRDSVVNQLLARMDGFQDIDRPTLLVALTNRLDLIDSALLRPGRFEVQVQIPGPDITGREAILRIHTQRMYEAGRIAMPPPDGPQKATAAMPTAAVGADVDSYESLVSSLAYVTEGFTGAELAGLVRAAASYALERAVYGVENAGDDHTSERNLQGVEDCRVNAEDFGRGLADVLRSKPSSKRPEIPTDAPMSLVRDHMPDAAATISGSGDAVGRSKGSTLTTGEADRTNSASEITAASEAAVQSESDIGRSLSPEDLLAVQKLLLQKASERGAEDATLVEAAQVVAQLRRKGRVGDSGDIENSGRQADEEKDSDAEEHDERSRAAPKLKKFEHTGWFHTYE